MLSHHLIDVTQAPRDVPKLSRLIKHLLLRIKGRVSPVVLLRVAVLGEQLPLVIGAVESLQEINTFLLTAQSEAHTRAAVRIVVRGHW